MWSNYIRAAKWTVLLTAQLEGHVSLLQAQKIGRVRKTCFAPE